MATFAPWASSLPLSQLVTVLGAAYAPLLFAFLGALPYVQRELTALHNMLDNLLQWAKQQMQQSLLYTEPLPLRLAAEAQIEAQRMLLREYELTCHNDIPDSIVLEADAQQLAIILRNLLGNAIKYTPKEGKIVISAQQRAQEIVLSVADNGVGMSPERMSKLFLGQLKPAKGLHNERGAGIGLQLVQEAVGYHQGTVWVESQEGKGTVFFVSFPKAT